MRFKNWLMEMASIPHIVVQESKKTPEMSRRDFLDGALYSTLAISGIGGLIVGNETRAEARNELFLQKYGREMDSQIEAVNDEMAQKRLDAQIAEEKRQEKEAMYKNERENPGEIALGKGSDVLDLARVLYAEAREYHEDEDYLSLISNVVFTRTNDGEHSLKDVIYDTHPNPRARLGYAFQFSCFNDTFSNKKNYKAVKDPLTHARDKEGDESTWHDLFDFSRSAIENGLDEKYDDLELDFYWVDYAVNDSSWNKRAPRWAKSRTPAKTVVDKERNKTTRFYSIGGYKPRQRGH